MTTAELFDFMSKHRLGVLSYVSGQGEPRSALVGIAVTPALEIIFDTVSSSRKYENLLANPAASFVLGNGEITVQYEGQAFRPMGDQLVHYQQAYFTVWPDGPQRLSWPGITYFVLRPTWIRYSDFDQRPPFIAEFTF